MDMILNYIFVGFIFIFIMDILMSKLKNNGYLTHDMNFDWGQRLIAVIVWPLMLIWFCVAFCKEFFKDTNK